MLAVVAVFVALIRKPVAYAVGLALMSVPLLWWATRSLSNLSASLSAPSQEDQAAGRGYFTAPADNALAEAIVARDPARVAALASSANLGAVGLYQMTFMQLALEQAHADHEILGVLLRAGIDPDQDSSNLYALIYNDKNEALLRLVIDSGVDLKRHIARGNWFLFARYDWPEGLALMLDHGVDTEAEDATGYTEIMRAAQAGSWPTVEALLAHGARTDHVGHDRQTLRDLLPRAIAESRGAIPPGIIALQASLR
jgi:hypothetical protein